MIDELDEAIKLATQLDEAKNIKTLQSLKDDVHFIFDDAVRGYDEFQENAESLLIKNKWEYDWDGDVLNIYE